MLIINFAVMASLLGAGMYWSNNQANPELNMTTLEPPKDLVWPEMVNEKGEVVHMSTTRGRWLMVFFGFTHCPDICPTSLGYLAREYDKLPKHVKPFVNVAFVSLDPARDTPAKRNDYIKYYHQDFLSYSSSVASLKDLSSQLGIYFEKKLVDSDIQYTLKHSGDIFVIDPNGKWHGFYRPPFKPNQVSDDLQKLVTGDVI